MLKDSIPFKGTTLKKSSVNADSRPLKVREIIEIIQSFSDAARRAVKLSKFNDGVQILRHTPRLCVIK